MKMLGGAIIFLTVSSYAQPAADLPANPETEFLAEESRAARQKRLDDKKEVLEKSDWVKLTLNLTGDSDEIARKALAQLRKTPNIEGILRKGVTGPYRGLALDAIAALSLKKMVPDLLALGWRDDDGFIYQTLNTLLAPENSSAVLDHYSGRLADLTSPKRPSAPAAVAMIDTLTRLGIALKPEQIDRYLNHESHEVRLMTLRNLKMAIAAETGPPDVNRYLPLLKRALQGKPFQLRLHALFAWKELKPELKDTSAAFLNQCIRDPNMELRAECQFTADRYASAKSAAGIGGGK